MRFLFPLLLISSSLFGQSNDIQTQRKLKNYIHLDSIDIYSKDYPTELIEGSGFIKRKNKNIGSIGYSIEITKNSNNKIIRVLKSESNHYEKYDKKPQKNVINEITIYFDEFHQPDFSKIYFKNFYI
ncbi:hypothetical protein QFZ37_002379 [Chryseobacterium ginsenosidimutans]|uniref:hypothetical protein n=1 Tax=Chryseobacterium ginsenosidimutans TaxID=687846 RepID=UPI00278A5A70|nr:hypothetical protein [Chryseobacterium ginsenosidimutans]MDQ0594010.1 hypothetical protein [Chryseobacterium ginsenosidimutans]